MAKFKSLSGGHIRIFRFGVAGTIDIDEGDTYETTDDGELEALRDSPEVGEVREAPKSPYPSVSEDD